MFLTPFLLRQVCGPNFRTYSMTYVFTESPVQPKGPRVSESPFGARSLRGHPLHTRRVDGIICRVCSRWFVERIAVICFTPQFTRGVTYCFSVFLCPQYCFAPFTPRPQPLNICDPYALGVCGPHVPHTLGVYRPHSNFNTWFPLFYPSICDTWSNIIPFNYSRIAVPYTQIPYNVDVSAATPSITI